MKNNNTSNRRPFKVFLAGHCDPVITQTKLKSILRRIKGVKAIEMPTKTWKGYAFVEMVSYQAMKDLLKKKQLMVNGKVLHIKEYKRGGGLAKEKRKIEKRRVFIQSVPNEWSEDDFYHFFRRFGRIEDSYMVEPEGFLHQIRFEPRLRRVGYVLFYAQRDAQDLIHIGFLDHPEGQIMVKQSKPKEETREEKRQQGGQDLGRNEEIFYERIELRGGGQKGQKRRGGRRTRGNQKKRGSKFAKKKGASRAVPENFERGGGHQTGQHQEQEILNSGRFWRPDHTDFREPQPPDSDYVYDRSAKDYRGNHDKQISDHHPDDYQTHRRRSSHENPSFYEDDPESAHFDQGPWSHNNSNDSSTGSHLNNRSYQRDQTPAYIDENEDFIPTRQRDQPGQTSFETGLRESNPAEGHDFDHNHPTRRGQYNQERGWEGVPASNVGRQDDEGGYSPTAEDLVGVVFKHSIRPSQAGYFARNNAQQRDWSSHLSERTNYVLNKSAEADFWAPSSPSKAGKLGGPQKKEGASMQGLSSF